MPIQFLPPDVRERIAAGEVIERPASAVKELIENAIDAGASAITVVVRGAGYGSIRVTDDGAGIPADELPLALSRFATSKIRSAADLAGLQTLGYRGEALASIAAVAEVTISSRAHDAPIGARLTVKGTTPGQAELSGMPAGTTVDVRDLFYNVPSRRAQGEGRHREGGRITEVVAAQALARPDIRWKLVVSGSVVFETSGGGPRDAIAAVLGLEAARHLLPVDWQEPPVAGYLSPPGLTRSDRRHLIIAINSRPVRNAALIQPVELAYRALLPRGRHPLGIINIRIAPDQLDANIHPAKLEVRLSNEPWLAAQLTAAVEEALRRRLASPAWPRRGTLGLIDGQGHLGADFEVQEEPATYGPEPGLPDLRSLRAAGQIDNAFVLAIGPDGLYLVDQHRAHERVIYDDLRRSARHAQLSLEGLDDSESDADTHERLAMAACKSALKAGRTLDPGEQADLLRRLADSDYPTTCPHGSPTVIRFDNRFIRRQFGRR